MTEPVSPPVELDRDDSTMTLADLLDLIPEPGDSALILNSDGDELAVLLPYDDYRALIAGTEGHMRKKLYDRPTTQETTERAKKAQEAARTQDKSIERVGGEKLPLPWQERQE